jgi:hypothetical protein
MDPTAILTNSNTDTTIDPTTGRPWGVQTFTVPGLFTTDPDRVANNLPTFITSDTDIVQLTVKADLGFANFTSYSQYRQEDVNQSEDLDQTALPIFQLGLPIFDKTYSQEFLLTSKSNSRLQWTTGAFFFSNKDQYVTYIDNNVLTAGRLRLGGSSSTTVSYAGFLDGTYEVMPKLFVTAGARYSHDIVKDAYYNSAFTAAVNPVSSISSNKTTPRVGIRYKPSDTTASASAPHGAHLPCGVSRWERNSDRFAPGRCTRCRPHTNVSVDTIAQPCFEFYQVPSWSPCRFDSNRNQVRRSVSSIQFSIRLAVAMSRSSSTRSWTSRRRAASV